MNPNDEWVDVDDGWVDVGDGWVDDPRLARNYPQAQNRPGFFKSVGLGARNYGQGMSHAFWNTPGINQLGKALNLDAPAPPEGTFMGRVGEYVGEAAPVAALGTAGLARMGAQAPLRLPKLSRAVKDAPMMDTSFRGRLADVGQDTAEFFGRHPWAGPASEVTALTAAGAGREGALAAGLPGSVGEIPAGMVGGMTALLPAQAVRHGTALKNYAIDTLAPGSKAAAENRLAMQLQQDSANPAEDARRVLEDADRLNISPARATRSDRHLAREAHLRGESPAFDARISNMERDAQNRLNETLRGQPGDGRNESQWMRRTLNEGAPPGTYAGSDNPGENLNQFFKDYQHAYRDAYGHPAPTKGMREEVVSVIMDPAENLAQTPSREFAVARFNKAMTAVEPYVDADGLLDTEHLLSLRHTIRTDRRNLDPDNPAQNEARILLGEAENRITARIEQAIPEHMREQLHNVDGAYKNFRTLTRAVKGGRGRLNSDNLDTAIAGRAQSEIAYSGRMTDQGLRGQAEQGAPIERVFGGNVQEARRMVYHASPKVREQIHADFSRELWKRTRRDVDRDSRDQYADGARLLQTINDEAETMRALGFTDEQVQGARRIADDLMTVQRMTSEEATTLIEDGPNSILQLISAIGGAQTGQRFAGSGIGSSLVLAQYMSNKSRRAVATFSGDRVYKLAEEAMTNPQLYADLMLRPTANQRQVDRAINRIKGYVYPAVYHAGEDIVEEAPEHRGAAREIDTSGMRLNMYD